MDDHRFDALTRSTSRRQALRLLAGGAVGGALALGAGTAPEARALTARPALPKGWTHLTGTTTGLLFYQRGTGRGASGTFVDGLYTRAAAYTTFHANWNSIVGATRSLVFRSIADELYATGYLDATGRFVAPPNSVLQFPQGDRVFPGTRSGRYALLGPPDGATPHDRLYPYALTAGGYPAEFRPVVSKVDAGWTHGAGAGFDTYLFYRGDTGAAATGRIEVRSGADGMDELNWVPRSTYAFSPGWTHVVGTFNGGILVYNRRTGEGATGYLDDFASFTQQRPNPTFGAGWSHVVGAGPRGILFYNATTGKGTGGFLNALGVWTKTTTYG